MYTVDVDIFIRKSSQSLELYVLCSLKILIRLFLLSIFILNDSIWKERVKEGKKKTEKD